MTKPRIELLKEKKLLGKHLRMSLTDNRTGELWRNFMHSRKLIKNSVDSLLYSLQVYDSSYFRHFNPAAEFDKWAAVEVSDYQEIPEGMEEFILKGGLYAVFEHKGSGNDPSTFQYIFNNWLPDADYLLDNRPHFEILGEKYRNNDPGSEEEIWIPIRHKGEGA